MSRADSTWRGKSWRRQALMYSKRKIPDSWRTGWKARACTSFALYLKVFKNHLYYLWHVRVLSIKPCLHTQLTKLLKSFPGVGAFDHLEWTYDGAFEQLSGLGRGNLNKNFPIIQMPWGLPGGMFKLRFDWYITSRGSKVLLNVVKSKFRIYSSFRFLFDFSLTPGGIMCFFQPVPGSR